MARSKHRKKASYWVKNQLAHRYGVNPARVKDSDKLTDWGFAKEEHFAELTSAFNHATRLDPDWHGSAFTPPELIKRTRDGTVGDIADFIAENTSASSLALLHVPDAGQIQTFLIGQLGPPRQNKVTKDYKFNADIVLAAGEENNIERDFCKEYKIAITGLLKYCSSDGAPTVRQVAVCMANYIRTRGRIAA